MNQLFGLIVGTIAFAAILAILLLTRFRLEEFLVFLTLGAVISILMGFVAWGQGGRLFQAILQCPKCQGRIFGKIAWECPYCHAQHPKPKHLSNSFLNACPSCGQVPEAFQCFRCDGVFPLVKTAKSYDQALLAKSATRLLPGEPARADEVPSRHKRISDVKGADDAITALRTVHIDSGEKKTVERDEATEDLALIDRLLAKPEISEEFQSELLGHQEDIAEGRFTETDRKYLRAVDSRLSDRKARSKPKRR